MAGGPCGECGATLFDCDEHIREHGSGCCDACFTRDTHGLLTSGEGLTRLVAQLVIARHEHARTIRMLIADVSRLIEENALLRGRVDELERQEQRTDAMDKRRLLVEALGYVRSMVHDLPERIEEVEDCVRALETHLRLRRRPKAVRQKAIGPGPAA